MTVASAREVGLPYRHARLSCGHQTDESPPINDRTDWYRAVTCPICKRPRSIVCLSYGTTR